MNQKNLFIQLETDFEINKPLFLNANNWYDTNLCFADQLTENSIGRYRINPEFSNKKIAEFWFDIESSPFDEKGNKITFTKHIINDRFDNLKKCVLKLADVLLPFFNYKDRIYVRSSGSGFHVFLFADGLVQDQWLNLTRFFVDESKLPNTKNASSLVFGIDIDAVISTKRKIRETYSSNTDKIKHGKVDYKNYCSCFTLQEFEALDNYPFCGNINDIKSPDKYVSFKLPDSLKDISMSYKPKAETSINGCNGCIIQSPKKTDFEIPTDINGSVKQLSKCPAYWSMLKNPNADWYERNFLVKWLKYGMKLNEQQILSLIDKHCGWSDYKPSITAFYVHKHFINGTAETKYKMPIRKKVLMKYGHCKDDCEECVYYEGYC